MANVHNTLTECLKHWAEHEPEREAFTFFDRNGRHSVWTPKQLYGLACRLANRLKGYGFKSGDVIGNALQNSPERLVTDFASLLAGCKTVNCQVGSQHDQDIKVS